MSTENQTVSFGPEIDQIMDTLNVPLDVRERLANRGLSLATAAYIDETDMSTTRVPPITARALLHELRKLSGATEPTHRFPRKYCATTARWNQPQVISSSSPSSSLDMEMTQLADDDEETKPRAFDFEAEEAELTRLIAQARLDPMSAINVHFFNEEVSAQEGPAVEQSSGTEDNTVFGDDEFGDVLIGILGASLDDPSASLPESIALQAKFQVMKERAATHPEEFTEEQLEILNASTPGDVKEELTCFIKTFSDAFNEPVAAASSVPVVEDERLGNALLEKLEIIALQAKFETLKERAAAHPEEFTKEQLEALSAANICEVPGVKEEVIEFLKEFKALCAEEPPVTQEEIDAAVKTAQQQGHQHFDYQWIPTDEDEAAGEEVIRAALEGPTVEIGPSSIDIPFNFTLESKREFIYMFGGPLVKIGPASSSVPKNNIIDDSSSGEVTADMVQAAVDDIVKPFTMSYEKH